MKTLLNKIKNFWKKIFPYKIILVTNKNSKWTIYRDLHKKFHIDHKMMKEVCELYGNNFQNVIEYKKEGKTKNGNIIWKIKK